MNTTPLVIMRGRPLSHRKPVTHAMTITHTRCTNVEPSASERDMPGTFVARKLQQQQQTQAVAAAADTNDAALMKFVLHSWQRAVCAMHIG
jgi:hypothetical protein